MRRTDRSACQAVVVALGIALCAGLGAAAADAPKLPRLVDLGAATCIPCKAMAPILEELAKTFAGRLVVEVIDLNKDAAAADKYGIGVIPTQVFFDVTGKELFRHEGFFSREDILAKWQEFGVDLGGSAPTAFSRWEPAKADTRARSDICYMCDGDIGARTKVTVKTGKGDVYLCSPHCYFIMLSCMTEDKTGIEDRTTVADWKTGAPLPMASAVFLSGLDEKTGRPTIKAFAKRGGAVAERSATGGSIIGYQTLLRSELTDRCGFCDRAVYPEDAALVKVNGIHTWGCCSHCALGVAARTGADIEVHERDRLTGEPIIVKTLQGSIASIEPSTAVAWFGQRTKPDGTHASAGCFHQGFFTTPGNLRKWLEANPLETGEMITINKALADKLALSPQQIQKACKIGECAPK
jgi:thioredoxin 1